jgi:peptidoglycan glycosyltransferase
VIDKKGFNSKSGLTCRGNHPKYGIHDYHNKKHGWVGLWSAFKLSCNVYFGEAGVRLGPELLQKAELFGFNRSWNLTGRAGRDLTAKSLAFSGVKQIQGGGRWQPADFTHNPKLVAMGGIGQNVIAATPLQMALAGAAIANHGSLMTPYLVDRVTFAAKDGMDEGFMDWWHNKPQKFSRVCSQKSAAEILKMMQMVMYRGTGYALPKLYRSKGKYKLFAIARKGRKNLLAGKTGTAETGRGDHSWFVAVAPVDKPRYAIAAIVEYGGLGAKAAGKAVVKTILAALNSD